MKRLDGESYIGFAKRITNLLQDGVITANEWGESILGENIYSQETNRRCGKFMAEFLEKVDEDISEDKIGEMVKLKEEISKERKKLQTTNAEYNEKVRHEARVEMLNEKIVDTISNLEPIVFKQKKYEPKERSATGVLCIADAHNGVEINMKSLFNEVVNVYSPETLKARLESLLWKVVDDMDRMVDYDKLIVFDLGDQIQNILRLSDLAKLKTGVLESALDYANTISCWLNELSNELEVPIEYICLGGNHCEMRLLEKGRNWEEENLGYVIREFVDLRLKDNPNITVAPYSEFGFKTVEGINILAIHGDDAKKDLEEISYWENFHQISIDILLMGHVHHSEQMTVGYGITGDKEVIKVPSLVGVDSFSKKCRKLARAGAKFMLFEDGEKTWERTYMLN